MSERVFVIAEAGVNHNGSLDLARKLIDVAVTAGADAIKFQTFRAELLATTTAAQADYQIRATGKTESQVAMLKRLELSEAMHEVLVAHAEASGIEFMSTPFDTGSLSMLVDRFHMRRIKVPSGELTNAPLLLAMASCSRPLVVSTGMATLGEIEAALGVIAFGLSSAAGAPCETSFQQAYAGEIGQQRLREQVTLLHCTSQYPAPVDQVHLRAMDTMRTAFGLRVGYSDHTSGIACAIAAAARGASVIEKHITVDRALPGPDHGASLEPAELGVMINAIREVEAALGETLKAPAASESATRAVARKSLVAIRPIAQGERFSADNLGAKRPGTGVSAMRFWDYVGRTANRAYVTDELIDQ
jgi:N-acetylneuraminate synthase